MSTGDPDALMAVQQSLLGYSTEFLVFVDRDGEVVLGAGDGLHILGYEATDQRGEQIIANVHPDDVPAVIEVTKRARRSAELDETLTVRARRKDGGWVLLEARIQNVIDHPVLGTGAVLRLRQIGDIDESAPPLAVDERFASLTASLPTGVLTVDADGRVVETNAAASMLLRRSFDDLVDSTWTASVHPDDRPEIEDALQAITRGDARSQAIVRTDVEGLVRWMHVTLVGLGRGCDDGWLVAIDDVTDRHRATVELAHRATHDVLTGLPNRALLDDRLERACDRLRTEGRSLTLLFGDLDRFKEINDQLGHQAGDDVLREVSVRLRRAVRATDTVVRLGGDEFVVVCEDLTEAESVDLADRITSTVALPMAIRGERVHLTMSVGVIVSCSDDTDPAELLARADAEMYQTKGRRA